MAQRRMFSLQVIDTDLFIDMPATAQNLYFHLGMRADDDGFISNAKTLKRMVGASDDDLKVLCDKGFLIAFENGVVVISDWKINNQIRKDRYNPTRFQNELNHLRLENGRYIKLDRPLKEVGNQMATNGKPDGNQMATQVRLGKVRLGKDRLDYLTNTNSYINFNFNCLDPKPTEKEIEQFLQLTRSLPADLVEYALKQTIAYCRQPTLNYAATIIMNFKGKGIDTLSKAKAWETNRVHQDELEAMDLPKIPIFKLADQPKGDNQ